MYFYYFSLQNYIDGRIYFLTGVKDSRRNIDIKAVRENFVTSMNVCNATDKLFLDLSLVYTASQDVTMSVPFLTRVRQNL